jgi:hypothetical protein
VFTYWKVPVFRDSIWQMAKLFRTCIYAVIMSIVVVVVVVLALKDRVRN